MRVAQQLYEGVDTGGGSVGLITYMRTDSTTLAAEAVAEIRGYIARAFGARNVPRTPRVFRTRARNAQEAHEAIRPTSVARTPESLAKVLPKDQARLYELVWKRTVACQMLHATIDTVAVELTCGAEPRPVAPVPDDLLRATGSSVADPGFLAVYEEGVDDKAAEKERRLPPLEKGEVIALEALRPEQHFTEPPPPLLRGDPDPRAGGLRDRPPLDLCGDHLHPSAAGVRRAGEAPLPAHRRRPPRQRLRDRAFRRLRGL